MAELQKQNVLNGGLGFVSIEKQHGESCEVTEVYYTVWTQVCFESQMCNKLFYLFISNANI